jgi:AcrR family transcriptional regulator
MATAAETSRKTRILDAAERAFADLGFEGASLRGIVQRARVNLATVYYYFESKDGLMAAVCTRRFEPLRQQHLQLLREREEAAGGAPLPTESILEAMLLPPLQWTVAPTARDKAVTRLIGRLATEPHPRLQELLRREFGDVRQAFLRAFQRSVPHVPLLDLRWRVEFVWGAMAFVLCNPAKIEKITDGLCNPADTRTVLAQMVRFFSAGFRAPAAVALGAGSVAPKRE